MVQNPNKIKYNRAHDSWVYCESTSVYTIYIYTYTYTYRSITKYIKKINLDNGQIPRGAGKVHLSIR